MWLVNVHAPGSAPYAPLYPGDEDVDSVAVDGYNGGAVLPWGGWRSPREVFGASVRDLRRLSDRPVVITEVGSAEQGGDKAAWIRELFGFAGDGGTRAVVWFDHAKEAGWRIASTPGAASAFRGAVAQDGREGPPPLPPRLRGGGQR